MTIIFSFLSYLGDRVGFFFQPSILGRQQTQVYSVCIYRPRLGEASHKDASTAVGFPAHECLLPQDSIFLTAAPEALPEETGRVWIWLKVVALLLMGLGSNLRSDTSLGPFILLFYKQRSYRQ